jgi:polygalacturonase
MRWKNILATGCLAAVSAVAAQDTRKVSEPAFPAVVCSKLSAQLHGGQGGLAEGDEGKLDTFRIQKAMDDCAAGQALELAPAADHNAFLTGPLELRKGVTLLVDKGVTLYGSRDPKLYELSNGSCGVVNNESRGCKPLIHAKDAAGAGIMGDGTIDGRGASKLLGGGRSWWDLANDKGNARQQVPRLIEVEKSNDFTVYRITLKNSANFHFVYSGGDGLTVWGLIIDTPVFAKNTDGFDPGSSKNITITHSYIRDGDDNIAIKGGNGPVTNMSVIHNHFYWGHGMSIGSETNAGVNHVLVEDLSLDGTESGIRIKSNSTRGGLVEDITYRDVCIHNSKNPISLSTDYFLPGSKVDSLPVFRNIVLQNVRVLAGKNINLEGYDHTHRIGIQFDGVTLDNPTGYKFKVNHTDIIFGPGPVNFTVPGEDSTARGKPVMGSLPSCAEKLVPFPVK